MGTFKRWLSWLVPVRQPDGFYSLRGERFIPATEHYRALDTTLAERQKLRAEKTAVEAQLREAEARRETAEAKLKHRMQTNVVLQANLEKAEAKFEAACIVNHLQRQKQISYERSGYAASMGGMILDNQEEIARIAAESRRAIKAIRD